MTGTTPKNYDVLHEDFQWDLPETFNFGTDVVDIWAQQSDHPALIWADDKGNERRFTFADIKQLSDRLANCLRSKGVEKGDRVIIMLPRIPEWQISMVACLKLGAIPIPCVSMLTAKDISYRSDHSGAIAAITTAADAAKFESDIAIRLCVGGADGWDDLGSEITEQSDNFQAETVDIEDPALMFYTSGSTGMPKGVCHASRGLFAWRYSAIHWLSLTQDDVMWCTADTGWSKAGTSILFGPWSCGTTVFFYDGKFDQETRVELLERYGITVFCAAATEIRQLMQVERLSKDRLSLRLTVSAGEAVNPDIVSSWLKTTGSMLLDGYGQTETLMTILNYPFMPVKPGSMGRPLPGIDATVFDDDGHPVPRGVTGQLAIKAPNPQLLLGYWNDDERTEQSYLEHLGSRWFMTGDTAYMDEDGYFFFRGRDDDIINSSGYRIGPTEVENALMEHPAVRECAVAASPDPTRGEIVKAFVVLKEGVEGSDALVAELQDLTKAQTAPYKYPRKIEFIDALPKTPTGKIRRNLLREQEFTRGSR